MLRIILLLTVLLVGCTAAGSPQAPASRNSFSATERKPNPAEHTPARTESSSSIAAAEGMYMLVNGTEIALGMNYADVREGLGAETAPEQEFGSCDEDPSALKTVHFYPDLTVTEDSNGVICGIELNSLFEGEGDSALIGKVTLGTTLDEAVAVLGEPENYPLAEDDYALIYREDGQVIYVFLDVDGKQIVSDISIAQPGDK